MIRWRLVVSPYIFTYYAVAFTLAHASNDIVRVFNENEKEGALNHLVVDVDMGRVFVGGVNRIYQLSPELEVAQMAVTGPVEDSADCSVLDCPVSVVKKPTNNVNKALVIDYATIRLISCGSVFQGMCSVRNLHNISDVRDVHESVVANTATASTVAFIAPGPPTPPVSKVMYVGVTITGSSPYGFELPAISSRSLEKDRMFLFAHTDFITGTRMFVNSLIRGRYPINYIYGFSSDGFSYFLTTQLRSIDTDSYYSKLVRVCHDDEHYYSYTEIPIACTGEGGKNFGYNLVQAAFVGKAGSVLAGELGITTQDDVLFAVFSQSEAMNTNTPSQLSGLCVYSLKSIRKTFTQNIKSCFSGNGSRGLDFISPSHPCVGTKLQSISEDFCGINVNTPLGGEQAVEAVPVLLFNTRLTAVAATSIGVYTVVFVGTANGHLKKVVVESSKSAFEYGDIAVDEGSPVNKDLFFDSQLMHLYVMTGKRVSKVKLQECSVYKTCLQCLGDKDPYCGWCSLENKCSLRLDCHNAAKDPLYWISYPSGRCTTITQVTPFQLQRTTARTLDLVIENLPTLPGEFLCVFTALNRTVGTTATRKPYGVNCTTPRTDYLPPIPFGQHHFTAKLAVRMTSGPDFVATNFTFFDCNTYSSCTQCVSSSFPCNWCVDGYRCTHDTAENCRNDILVTGVSRIGPSYRSGPGFCPTINSPPDGTNEILLPSGVKRSIKVKVHIVGQFIVQTRFVCQFNVEGRITSVNAQLLADTIYCDRTELSYASPSPNTTASFAVIWGGSKPLDNPHNIHILLYRCHDMADNCGICTTLSENFGCGWCQGSNRCEVQEQCLVPSVWLNRNQTCPKPEIHSFRPMVGPWDGRTNITIEGINLGRNISDIYNGVTIAGINCQPIEELYIKTKRIVCTLDGPGSEHPRDGPVVVRIADSRGESKEHYAFVNPHIDSISPKFGPQSGGTRLKIKGEYLNAGSNIQALIDEMPCVILITTNNEIVCRTSHSYQLKKAKLRMKFDGGNRSFDRDTFEYLDDPVIDYADSGYSNISKEPKGIPSGGIKIKVVGRNFDSIQFPTMYVLHENQQHIRQCEILSNILMICESPAIKTTANIDPEKPLILEYGFYMDDVQSVQNMSKKGPFLLYPDPVYEKFDDGVKYYKSEYLTINGQHLDRACQEGDVVVRIGEHYCNVTSLSRHQLTCRLPTQEKLGAEEPQEVIVHIGRYLMYYIGKLSLVPNEWLNRTQTGPIPEIRSFQPMVGPWDGRTNITIEGINLGRNISDIYNGVTIAGINCQPIEELYIKTKRIVCTLDGPGSEHTRDGPVVVRIADSRGESKEHYAFVNPHIDSISPKFGPQSGGTRLKIKGEYLNAGSNIQALIDEMPCVILITTNNEIVCRTSHSYQLKKAKLRMKFDGGNRSFDRDTFEYLEDPVIDYADSGYSNISKKPKGIPSGGIKIKVVGRNFDSIQFPTMYVLHENQQHIRQCEILSNILMICESPAIKTTANIDPEKPLLLEYGFYMDDVQSVQNMSKKGPFLLYPDPVYEKFDDGVKYYKSEYLTINGQHLDCACQEGDVVVRIGKHYCNVTSLSRHQLICRLPTQEELGAEEPQEVTVHIGRYLMYHIGKLNLQ